MNKKHQISNSKFTKGWRGSQGLIGCVNRASNVAVPLTPPSPRGEGGTSLVCGQICAAISSFREGGVEKLQTPNTQAPGKHQDPNTNRPHERRMIIATKKAG